MHKLHCYLQWRLYIFSDTHLGFRLVCSEKDLYKLLSVLAQKHIRSNLLPLIREDFEDQAIAKRGSRLHEANLFCVGFEYVRLFREGVSHI